jgi:flagellar basal body rod protein FlgG
MDSTTSILASGLRARAESLDLTANNLANVTTPAFKAELERYQIYRAEEELAARGEEFARQMPDLRKSWINFAQGTLSESGRMLDFALEGPGQFVLETEGGMLLSRNGSFQIGTDGVLRSREGFKVKLLELDGRPIRPGFRLDPRAGIDVDAGGVIRQGGLGLARFDLKEPVDLGSLRKAGNSYFALEGGAELGSQLRDAGKVVVRQGWVEGANLDATTGSIQLIQITRQFELLQKALQLHGEMSKRSTEEVGRV